MRRTIRPPNSRGFIGKSRRFTNWRRTPDITQTVLRAKGFVLDSVLEERQLESAVSRKVAGMGNARRALHITTEQVQDGIPRNAVLVELLRYDHYLGKLQFESR